MRVGERLKIWGRSGSAQDMEEGQGTFKLRSGFSISQLESEVPKLQLELQILPELHQDHGMPQKIR